MVIFARPDFKDFEPEFNEKVGFPTLSPVESALEELKSPNEDQRAHTCAADISEVLTTP